MMKQMMTIGCLFVAVQMGCSAKGSVKISRGTPNREPKVAPPTPEPEVAVEEKKKKPNFGAVANAMKKMRARIKADRIEIDEKVHFATGKAEILPESFGLLDDVAEVMNDNVAVTCEVAGHTDNVGKVSFNKKLSQDRAEAVRAYLLNKGIAVERLIAMGYGPDEPIADNASDEGREQNRRVEFRVQK